MAMHHLITGQNNCAPDDASSSNPFGALANAVLGQSSKAQGKMYLLLLGTTGLSLVTTPLIFKLIPVVTHLGMPMRWFPSENSMQNEGSCGETCVPDDHRLGYQEMTETKY